MYIIQLKHAQKIYIHKKNNLIEPSKYKKFNHKIFLRPILRLFLHFFNHIVQCYYKSLKSCCAVLL